MRICIELKKIKMLRGPPIIPCHKFPASGFLIRNIYKETKPIENFGEEEVELHSEVDQGAKLRGRGALF